ncbi:hypothetical protein FOBRF1_010026 [Fusarium oxysporum]
MQDLFLHNEWYFKETETQPPPCNHQSRPVSPGTPGQRPWLALRVAGAGQLLGAMALSDGMDGSIERKARNERGRPGNGPDDPLLGQRITMAAAMDEDGWVPYYCMPATLVLPPDLDLQSRSLVIHMCTTK